MQERLQKVIARAGVASRRKAEELITGKRTHTNTSYFVMVALDDDGMPVEVPGLILETEEDRRRNAEARQRALARKPWRAP